MGSAALFNLAQRGLRVIGFEQFEPGHKKGSSHGESRIIRKAYFEDPSYVPLLIRAYNKWRDLESISGKKILNITGILEAGYSNSKVVRDSINSAYLLGIKNQILSAAEINNIFPGFSLPLDWNGVFQPDGGFIIPEVAIGIFLEMASLFDAHMEINTNVKSFSKEVDCINIFTNKNDKIKVRNVIITTGAWISQMVPGIQFCTNITRQPACWFSPLNRYSYNPDVFPVFILDSTHGIFHGLPSVDNSGLKVACHNLDDVLAKASDLIQDFNYEDEKYIRRIITECIPRAQGKVQKAEICMYTNTPDGNFIIDRSPDDRRIIFASPCSGHGFKFASVIGEILADMAQGVENHEDLQPFRLSRLM